MYVFIKPFLPLLSIIYKEIKYTFISKSFCFFFLNLYNYPIYEFMDILIIRKLFSNV